MFQAESVRDAAFGCDWVGTAIPFQRCLMFIIATANKEFQLTAGKFVPVSNLTMINVGKINILYFFMGYRPLMCPGFLRVEGYLSHSDTHHSVGLRCTSDQPDAEKSTWKHATFTRDRLSWIWWNLKPPLQQANCRKPRL